MSSTALSDPIRQAATARRQASPVSGTRRNPRKPPPLVATRRVLFVTTEISDFIKAGGLGDVSASLPRALSATNDIRVLIPGYRSILARCGPVTVVGKVDGVAGLPTCDLGETIQPDGLHLLLLLHPALYEREGSPYSAVNGAEWADNAIRFATLAHAAAEIASGRAMLAWRPDLLHLNDWPNALAASYLHWRGGHTPCVLTIHNLAYQGLFPQSLRTALDMPAMATEMNFHGQLSFLRSGIAHADYISTVSLSYARQITQPLYGCGLNNLLTRRDAEGRLVGIVNGIDGSWDTRHDPALAAPFSADDWRGRAENAADVREHFGLRADIGPLFVFVARLVHQKGIDMICEATPQIIAAGGQLAIIGQGEPHMERAVLRLARRFPGQVGVRVTYDEALARRMFAGSDFLLMPSRFEPCGLSQMYAQKYGSLPIAHATGGLIDTIDDGVTGLLFRESTVSALRRCLQRAFRVFAEPELLRAMRRAAMLESHDWADASRNYLLLYQQAAPLARAA
jgi:starch synthase